MRQIVRRGRAVVRRLEPRAASPLGPLRRITAVIGHLLPMADVPTSRHSGRNRICRLITTIAAIRSRAPTIRLLPVLIRRRELIPHRAAAIQPRLAPTPHPAAAIAVEVAAAGVPEAVEATSAAAGAHAVVVEVAEAHTAVEVPARTVTVKSFCKLKGPPESSGRAFCFRRQLAVNFPSLASVYVPNCSWRAAHTTLPARWC